MKIFAVDPVPTPHDISQFDMFERGCCRYAFHHLSIQFGHHLLILTVKALYCTGTTYSQVVLMIPASAFCHILLYVNNVQYMLGSGAGGRSFRHGTCFVFSGKGGVSRTTASASSPLN